MTQNNPRYPTAFVLSDELKAFFALVTEDTKLQEKLALTAKISDVARIAKEFGFTIQAGDVLKAQAGRIIMVLKENPEDVQPLLLGKKTKVGAQWGRGGGGFLDSAGYWLMELYSAAAKQADITENQIALFLNKANQDINLKNKIINAKTFEAIAMVAKENGFNLEATDLLSFQANVILHLNAEKAEILADH